MTVLSPDSEAALAEAIADAHGRAAPLAIRGGGTRHAPSHDRILSTSALTGITLYEPGALTLSARAGTPVAEIEAVLAAENQILPFEPMDHRAILGTTGTPTIGGVVALNVSGPRRIRAGACRDSLIGIRFVDGTGQVIKSGGRVMKNVTGLDLAKLLCGARGTLGVISEVTFKLLPAPETGATLLLKTPDIATAVTAMSRALGTPYEVTGAAFDGAAVALRVEGLAGQVGYRLDRLADLFAGLDQSRPSSADHAALWVATRDATALTDTARPLWRISVKPSDAPAVAAHLGASAPLRLDWGGGLIWAESGADSAALRAEIARLGGHATLVRGATATTPALHPEPPRIAALSAGLRARFDPKGILNPGMAA